MAISGQAVLENVRRYRNIASLYRQTAAFRPLQRVSLLEQAQLWEERAVTELEDYFVARDAAGRWPRRREPKFIDTGCQRPVAGPLRL
jgi:hypothetical protein